MFDIEKQTKKDNLIGLMCSGHYQDSFFKPFNSFSDAKKNVKALAALPILNLANALHATLNALFLTIFGLANLAIGAATFDLNELKCGGASLKDGARSLMGVLYHAVSIITDTLGTLVRLVTHSLATVALGVSKTAEAISECFTPSTARSI